MIDFIAGMPTVIRWIAYAAGFVWLLEMFCLPFNLNRLIWKVTQVNKQLDKILELVGKDKLVGEKNGQILSLILGNVLEGKQATEKKKGSKNA